MSKPITVELSPEELAYIIGLMKVELKNADAWLDFEDGGGQYNDEQIEQIQAEIDKYKALLRRLQAASQ